MAYFEVSEVHSDSVFLYLSPDSYQYYLVFIRTTGGTEVYNQTHYVTYPQTISVFGLYAGMSYVVNVAPLTGFEGSIVTWLGAQTFTTLSSGSDTYSVTIMCDANGGSGAPPDFTVTGYTDPMAVTLYSTIPTRNGYVFLGWSYNPSATSATFDAGGTYYFTSGIHYLYAVWSSTGGGGGGTGGGGGGGAYIGGNHVVPHIWTGSTWRACAPRIWTGSTWRTTQ